MDARASDFDGKRMERVAVHETAVPVRPTSRSSSGVRRGAASARPAWVARWGLRLGEAAAAFAACLMLPFLVRGLNVNPMQRTGQVSGLAALQLRYALIACVVVGAVLAAHQLSGGRWFEAVKRMACGATAGLASGFVAGGTVIALLGTPWPIFGLSGDTGRLVEWSTSIVQGHGNPNPSYPPLTLHLIAWWAQWFHGGNTAFAFRDLEIIGAAVTGPLAYLAWRLVLNPLWALIAGVLPAFAIIDPYKPYSAIVMIMLLPMFIRFIRYTRRTGGQAWKPLLLQAAAFGVAFAVLFLFYPGSSLWCAPGLMAALVLTFPWSRRGAIRLAAALATAFGVFFALAGFYVLDLLGPIDKDTAYGFDAFTNPVFFSMWRTDMPGTVGQWPPPGELGGTGLFTILTMAGIALALWLGLRRSAVVTVVCVFAGTWIWRMWFASQMWATGTVQLWPRTDNQLLYCSLVAAALAACMLISRFAAQLRAWQAAAATATAAEAATDADSDADSDVPTRAVAPARTAPARLAAPARLSAAVGALFAVLMLLGTTASMVSDAWMPTKTNSYKILAYVSQTMRKPNGNCPEFAPDHQCFPQGDPAWEQMFYHPTQP